MNARPQQDAAESEALIGDVERLEAVIAGWDGAQQAVAIAFRRAVEALNREALRRIIGAVKAVPGALEPLREAAADPLVYAVLRHHGLVQPSLQERVDLALASVRPLLAAHGGDVEFVAFLPPDAVEVRFLGACDGCPASTLTFVAGVKKAIEEHCPEIAHIRQVKGAGAGAGSKFSSPFAPPEDALWRDAAALAAIPEGGVLACVVDGEAVMLSAIGGAVKCYADACSHLGLPLSDGEISGGRIACLHHGFEYDLATGECLTAPEVQLRPFPARVAGARVEIRLKG